MGRLLLFTVLTGCVLTGCGRISFAPTVGDAGNDNQSELVDAPIGPRWTLVQTSMSTSSTVTIAPSSSRNLIVVAAQIANAGSITSITDNAADDDDVNANLLNESNTYVAIPAARATNTNPSNVLEIWYAQNARRGATKISIGATAPVLAAVAWEVSGIRTIDPLDTAGKLDGQPATIAPVGPSITTSTAGEFIVSVAIVANVVTGASAGSEFTNDCLTNGNGWAHLADPGAAAGSHQAQWAQNTSGRYCASAAAFRVSP